MKGAFFAVGGLFVLFTVFACGGGKSELISIDPQALLDQARAAMADLESYHTAFSVSTHPDDAPEEYLWELEFTAPDSYRILQFGAGGETASVCEAYIGPDVRSQDETCREEFTSTTGSALAETVYVGGRLYARQCEDVGMACGPWREQPRGPLVSVGPSAALMPGWPLVALEMAGDLDLVGQDKVDGNTLTHLRGSVNHLRMILENQRRVLTAAGITSFGTSCSVEANFSGQPTAEPICRELTFEESLESQEPGLSFYDENRAAIDVWVSRDDFLVHRVALTIPPDEASGAEIFLFVEYSRFNQVEIEAPR